MWTRLSYFFYNNFLKSGISHISFIEPLLTRLPHLLTLCDLEYNVSNTVTLCGLHYHVYPFLTFWCLEHQICYVFPSIGESMTCINPLRSRESILSRVSNINPLWTRLSYFFYINLLLSGISHILFIDPLLTRLPHLLTLCDLEYHVSNTVTLCGLHYHVYPFLTFWCIEHHICYVFPSIGESMTCINPLRSRESILSRVSNINPVWTRLS